MALVCLGYDHRHLKRNLFAKFKSQPGRETIPGYDNPGNVAKIYDFGLAEGVLCVVLFFVVIEVYRLLCNQCFNLAYQYVG